MRPQVQPWATYRVTSVSSYWQWCPVSRICKDTNQMAVTGKNSRPSHRYSPRHSEHTGLPPSHLRFLLSISTALP
jgi:hypothetical protein